MPKTLTCSASHLLKTALVITVCAILFGERGVSAQNNPATPVPDATEQATAATIHVVQRGENLFRISLKYNVTLQALMQANGISNPNLIYVGQVLRIP